MSAFLLQPKSIQCLIWGLAEEEAFYTNEEQQWIKEYMLPTYLEPDLFLGKGSFVQNLHLGEKEIQLRFAIKTKILCFKMHTKHIKRHCRYFKSISNCQSYPWKQKRDRETVICVWFVLIAGKASSIGIRAGEKITGNESYYLPVGIKRRGKMINFYYI